VDAIIPHPHEPRVLLLPTAGGWALPRARLPQPVGDSWWREAALINPAFGELLGWPLTTRYCAGVDVSSPGAGNLFVMEVHDPAPALPAGARWLELADLEDLPLAIPPQRAVLQAGWAEATGHGDAPGHLAWTRRGWFATAAAWIAEQLHARNLAPTGPVEQVRTWPWSCILRVPTTTGVVYFKAAPPLYTYEPVLTKALADAYPARIPSVLAVEATQGWLLMAGVEGVKLRQHPDGAQYLPRWEALLRDMARIQRAYTARVADLAAWGCADLRPAHVATAIDPLLAALPELLAADSPELTSAEVAAVQALAPRLKQMCAALDGYGIPPTLTHGDFHSGNILANDRECRVIDWAGFVGIAHPFCCLAVVFEEHTDPALRAHLRDIYLEGWTDEAPLPRLREAVALAVPLGLLCGALGHQIQLAAAPPPWDGAVARANLAWCLRELLKVVPPTGPV
jgi:hypothetical protein